MMNNIELFIYSYKGKNTRAVIDNLIANKSNETNLQIGLADQHPLNREELFKGIPNFYYHHIFWDWLTNQCEYKYNFIKRSKSTYTMFINDNVMLAKDWDKKLVDFVADSNKVVSGAGKISIDNKNIFYIKKNISNTEEFTLNNFVNRELIFGKTEVLKKSIYPTYVKYNGEEEHLSLSLFCNGTDIYGAPSNIYKTIGDNSIETLYTPFSVDHNYNEVIDLLEYGKNRYSSVLNRDRTLEDFIDFHGFNFKKLKKLPHEKNDVRYDPESLKMNKIDARRFIDRTKEIS